jgi:PAS domain S-box-containing protein
MTPPVSPNPADSLRAEEGLTFETLWEGIGHGIFILEVLDGGWEFRYQAFNPAIVRTQLLPVAELVGKTLTEALSPEEAAFYWQHCRDCVESGQPVSFEKRLEHQGQFAAWWFLTLTPLRGKDGEIDRLMVTTIDISQQKAVEAQLREREQTYRQILDAMGDYVLIKGPQSRILFANRAFRNYYSMTEEELQHIIDAPFNEPDYTQQYIKDDAFVFNTGQVLQIAQEPVTRHDGVVRLWNTVKSPVFNAEGRVIMTVGISRDITDAKAAEKALVESEAKFRRFVENANDLIYEISEQGYFTYLSPQFKTLFGYEVAEFLHKPFVPLVHLEDLPGLLDMNQRLFATGERQIGLEFRVLHKEGSWVWIVCSNVPIKDAQGNVIGFQGIARDVSDRKAAEAELRLYNQQIKAILDGTVTFLGLLDKEGMLLVANKRALKSMGLEAMANVAGMPFWEAPWWHTEENRSQLKAAITRAAQGEFVCYEVEAYTIDGIISVDFSIQPILDEQGEVVLLVPEGRDISDRKRAEKEQARLLAILEATSDFVGTADLDGQVLYFNQAALRMLGLQESESFAGRNLRENHPNWVNELFYSQALPAAIERGQWIGETALLTKDGEEIPLSQLILSHRSETGELEYFSTIARDISDQKQAETALRDYADRQTLLNLLANQIRNSLNLETVIQTTLEAIRSLLEIDACSFAWYNPEADSPTWNLIQEAKLPDVPSAIGSYPVALVGPLNYLIIHQEILQIDDVSQHEEPIHREFLERINCKSEILLPIETHTQQIGIIICVNYRSLRTWNDSEVELLKSVGDQLAIAISQAELYAQTQAKSQKLGAALAELQRTQAQVVQSEKMSSLGQLVAGIAHEINNPVNFIHGNLAHIRQYTQDLLELVELYQQKCATPSQVASKMEEIDLDFLQEDLPKIMGSMKVGTERIREIVKSLRIFSRLDEAEVKPVDIHEGIDSTLMILQNRLKAKHIRVSNHEHFRPEIKVIKEYQPLPKVECYAGQLNQVFMNILVNAIDAIDEMNINQTLNQEQVKTGQITISTGLINRDWVQITIADNGPGIPESVTSKVFDPFFTTKPVGQGTGMGLSISYQIITEKHKGRLNSSSRIGEGTQFVIEIPLHSLASV